MSEGGVVGVVGETLNDRQVVLVVGTVDLAEVHYRQIASVGTQAVLGRKRCLKYKKLKFISLINKLN